MKKALLIASALLLFAAPASAFAIYNPASICTFAVSGAGTTGTNGTYSFNGNTNTNIGVTENIFQNGGAGGTDYILQHTAGGGVGYFELTNQADSAAYYFDSLAAAGSYPTIDSVNSQGAGPVPTIVENCSGPPPPPVPWVPVGGATSTSALWAAVASSSVAFLQNVIDVSPPLVFFLLALLAAWLILGGLLAGVSAGLGRRRRTYR